MHIILLNRFPPDTSLILVHDPDDLLADERLLGELHARGFTVLRESDPVRLRYRVSHSASPLVIVTAGALNELPYDLWQQGHHVNLALHEFFPNLAYPLVQALGPLERARLFEAPQPARRLGERATQEHIFRHVYGLDLDALGDPVALVTWLSVAPRREPLPAAFRDALRQRLKAEPAYAGWPLDDLLDRPETLSGFLQSQWAAYLQQRGLLGTGEAAVPYLLDFDRPRWRDLLPRWLRAGLLQPVAVNADIPVEDWLAPGLLVQAKDARLKQLELLTEVVAAALEPIPDDFLAWVGVARQWAELTALRHSEEDLPTALAQRLRDLETRLDDLFPTWLERAYPALAGRILPQPHHLYHVPHFLAFQLRQGQTEKMALVILDGLSLADWQVLWESWVARHPRWQADLRFLLAQIPTVTAISRQALVSGLRPEEFAETITHNGAEARLWGAFWQREGLPAAAARYIRDLNAFPLAPDVRALCLVVSAVDEIHHKALLGPADAQTTLRRWRDHYATDLESALEHLLTHGFSVWLTSDHGHVVARGIGQPREGVIVQTRGLRARTYRDEHLVRKVQADFPETYLWHGDGLLPDDLWALIPHGRMAFAPKDEIHITHGGVTLDEVIVPLVRVQLKQ